MSDDAWLQLRSTVTAGATGASPDIILGGPKADPAWAENYDKTYNQTSTYSGDVFVYVRAKNGSDALAIGSATVWAARLPDLPTPANWLQLATADGKNSASIGADAGQDATTGSGLIWHPGGPPAPGAPYCLIAELSDDDHPKETVPSSVTTQADFDAFVAQSGRMAYLTVQDAPVVPTPKPSFSWALEIALDNDDPVRLGLSLTCASGPISGTLSYALDKPDSSGNTIGVGQTTYKVGSSYSQSRIVDENFSSTVTVSFQPPSNAETHAEFTFQVTTLSARSGNDGHHIEHPKLVAQYSVVFGQSTS